MANDSTTGGYLSPAAPPPTDIGIEDFIQAYLVGISGLPGTMVRPRFQRVVPKQPEPQVNWCAFGISRTASDAGPAFVHEVNEGLSLITGDALVGLDQVPVSVLETDDGRDTLLRHGDVDVLLSFYGPDAYAYAELTRDNASVPQNSEQLRAFRMGFVGTGDIIQAPDLVNQQWVHRYDMSMSLRRQTVRTYPVLNLDAAPVVMQNEKF